MIGRRCSHCGNNGHNSRSCSSFTSVINGGGLRLFGVQLSVASNLKKSFSLDCLSSNSYIVASSSPSSSSSSLVSIEENTEKMSNSGYLSDGMGRTQGRKKGLPWTEEEHRAFLAGLDKLGKGDWRGISRKFVTTRTPTQVASHAQKYFLRQISLNKKKRRPSLFDMVESSYQRTVNADESTKFKEPPPVSSGLDDQTLTLSSISVSVDKKILVDLNLSSDQESQLSSCLQLMPNLQTSTNSSGRPPCQNSSTVDEHELHAPSTDLVLAISQSSFLAR